MLKSVGVVAGLVSGMLLAVAACAAPATLEVCPPTGKVLNLKKLAQGEKVRKFRFVYAGQVTGQRPGALVRVWLPLPPTTEYQTTKLIDQSFPAEPMAGSETRFSNCMVYFEVKAPESGVIDFSMTHEVTRSEVKGLDRTAEELTADERRLFLAADKRVPNTGRPLDLLRNLTLPDQPVALGRKLYDKVDDHMKYDKSRPGYGTGDSVWACDSRFGNCTDFHSLFLSLARSKGLPSRFEIGFPIPDKRGAGEVTGYHCWAFFHTREHGWVPTDISEADKNPALKDYYFGNLTENRVTFSTGRDIELSPRQAGEPLNFFVYPYAEVDGKPVATDLIKKQFQFADIESGTGN